MAESFAAVLDRLAGQPDRFDQLRQLLDDTGLRDDYSDLVEETARRKSARYAARELSRSRFYAELVKRYHLHLKGPNQRDVLEGFDQHLPSIFEALDTAVARTDADLLVAFVKYIAMFMNIRGNYMEALALYEKIIASAERAGSDALLASAYLQYGSALRRLGRYDEAKENVAVAQHLAEEMGDRGIIANCLYSAGIIAEKQGHYEEGKGLLTRSLALARKLGNRWGIATILTSLGNVANGQRCYAKAHEFFKQALEINREIGDPTAIAVDLGNLGTTACYQGCHTEAEEFIKESLLIHREVGDRSGIATSLSHLGVVASELGRFQDAQKYFQEGLQLARETGEYHQITALLHNMAEAALRLGDHARAEGLLRESIEISQEIGVKDFLANHYNVLAEVLILQQKHDDALSCASRGLHIKREIGDRLGIAESLYRIASVNIKRGGYTSASRLLREALKCANEISSPEAQRASLITTALLLVQMNRSEKAAALLCGVQQSAKQVGYLFLPLSQAQLDEGLSKLATVLSAEQLDQIKAQAESMTLEELTDYALKALAELKAELPVDDEQLQEQEQSAGSPTGASSTA